MAQTTFSKVFVVLQQLCPELVVGKIDLRKQEFKMFRDEKMYRFQPFPSFFMHLAGPEGLVSFRVLIDTGADCSSKGYSSCWNHGWTENKLWKQHWTLIEGNKNKASRKDCHFWDVSVLVEMNSKYRLMWLRNPMRVLWILKQNFIRKSNGILDLNCLWLFVAAHLRGMRPTLTSQKDTLMLRKNSNIIYFLLDFNYNYIMYFNCCAYIRIRIQYVSLTMHKYRLRIYTEPNWSRLGRNRYGTNEYS